jgi:two-component system LytT family response regulator
MILKCIIIDDEKIAREALKKLLVEFEPKIEILAESNGIPDAIPKIKSLSPNLVFLDLEMADSYGFDLFDCGLSTDFEVVITSAFNDQSMEAINYGAADYIVKPVTLHSLKRAITRVKKILAPLESGKMVLFPTFDGIQLIPSYQIIRLEADRNYCWVFGSFGKEFCLSKNLGQFEPILEKYGFLRVHHSHMVSIYQIKAINKAEGVLEMKDGKLIPISREKRKRLGELIDQYQFED